MLARRSLLAGMLAAFTAPLTVEAQQAGKPARIGTLASSTESNFAPSVKVFRETLAAAGWMEGRGVVLDARYAGEQYARLPDLAVELVRAKMDVLVTMGTPATLAAMRATKTIPIVMESLADAVSSGIVSNLAKPGGNVTGMSGFAPELTGKRLDLIRELLPRAERIAVMANRSNAASAAVIRTMEATAKRMRLRVLLLEVREPADLTAASHIISRERADALLLVADPLLLRPQPVGALAGVKRRLLHPVPDRLG